MKRLSENDAVQAADTDERDTVSFTTGSPEETINLGQELGRLLQPGDVVALIGELGTGKTYLTKGIALGLGVPEEKLVRSASFVLVNRYDGTYPIWHIDAYRLDGPLDFAALGYEEYVDSGCIAVIEWAEKTGDLLPARTIEIRFEHVAPTQRRIHIDFSNIPGDRKREWRRVLTAR